ncbi:unnamed protein product [Closterium sp. NIES-54]
MRNLQFLTHPLTACNGSHVQRHQIRVAAPCGPLFAPAAREPPLQPCVPPLSALLPPLQPRAPPLTARPLPLLPRAPPLATRPSSLGPACRPSTACSPPAHGLLAAPCCPTGCAPPCLPTMTSLHTSSGSDGGCSRRCGAVRWGVSGGGQLQLQRSQHETLSPQQLREWYARRSGSGGSSGSRCASVQLGVSGGGLTQCQTYICYGLPYLGCSGAPRATPAALLPALAAPRAAPCGPVFAPAARELPLQPCVPPLAALLPPLQPRAPPLAARPLPLLPRAPPLAARPSSLGPARRPPTACSPPAHGPLAAPCCPTGRAPPCLPTMTSLHSSSGSDGGCSSSRCGAVRWGVFGGGRLQLQQTWAFWSSAHCPYVIRTEAAALGASESALPSTTPAEALHTFTLDSSLHLPSFSTNLVSTAALQDAMVTTTAPGGQRVSICTCARTGLHLATCLRAASPTISGLLATVVTNPSFESTTASALVAEMVDFAAACRLDYATALVAESESASPPSVGGECALGTDVLEDGKEDFECLATVVYRFASMLLALEGDPDAPDIPTPRSYAEAFTGPYSSQLQEAMDAEMASWKSTGTYVDAVPPSRANIVNGMWIFRVKRPPCSLIAFKARYVARCFSTQWSLWQPVYGLHQAPQEWHDTQRTTLAALGFTPSTADPSLFLRTDTSLLPFYVLVYVDDLVFATADTEALTLVKSELQKRHTCTDLGMEAVALHARESALLGTAPAKALHTFTLDSGTSRCFFCDSTTLTPLSAPVPVRLADPLGGPVLACSSAVLPCPAIPSGSLSSLHLPSFSKNLVSSAALQDAMVTTTTPGGQCVSICTCTLTGRHLATNPLLVSLPDAPDSPVAPSPCSPLPATPSWHALPPPYLWSSQVSASPLASSLPTIPDPESDLARAASPTVSCLLASVVTDPSFESSTVCAFVAELVDFGAACRLDYATVVVAESDTVGMGLVLGGRGPVFLTGHADASWVDDLATQRSSQGYTFILGSDSVSWRSTRSSSVLSSSCEAEIYAGAMAAQELHWLTYLLIELGEQPRSPPVLCQQAPGSTRPAHLDGTYAADFGFDPLGLVSDDVNWYVQAELVHCRWTMLGAAGVLIPDALRVAGLLDIPLWDIAGVADYGIDWRVLLAVEIAAFGRAEGNRWATSSSPDP